MLGDQLVGNRDGLIDLSQFVERTCLLVKDLIDIGIVSVVLRDSVVERDGFDRACVRREPSGGVYLGGIQFCIGGGRGCDGS